MIVNQIVCGNYGGKISDEISNFNEINVQSNSNSQRSTLGPKGWQNNSKYGLFLRNGKDIQICTILDTHEGKL